MAELPNIVLIDAHDLGTWLGSYGQRDVATPDLDRFAEQGARFAQHFATAPICIPSRTGIYAGRYHQSVGCYGQDAYDDDTVMIARHLRNCGYTTYLSGWNVPNDPVWAGYQVRLPFTPDSERTRDFFTGRCPHRLEGGPFFAHFSLNLVHRPFGDTYSQSHARTIKVPPYLPDCDLVRRDLACLIYKIGLLDRAVGRVLDAIHDSDLEERTLVVFTTDHGPAIARAKHTLYDSGIRTALMIRWPGVVPEDVEIRSLVSNVDLFPTLMTVLGLPVPAAVQGRSFAPLLVGGTHEPRQAAYSAYTWGRRAGLWCYAPARSVRTVSHKLIRHYTSTPFYVDTDWLGRFGPDRDAVQAIYGAPAPTEELFDLRADPWEQVNLADDPAYSEMRGLLACRLDHHLAHIGDRIVKGAVPNREGKPDVPLWEQLPDRTYRLRRYDVHESSDVPFGQPLRQSQSH